MKIDQRKYKKNGLFIQHKMPKSIHKFIHMWIFKVKIS